ncbi:MAG: aminotransferase class V-fold PLP-dependent enzyme [Thermoplasmatales archaeon]
MRRIYLDANSNYGLIDPVKDYLSTVPEFGNPNSLHFFGQRIKALVEEAREEVRSFFNLGDDKQVYFCSGATEAANWLMFSVGKTNKLCLVSQVEHACVQESARLYISSQNRIEMPVDYRCSSFFDDFKQRFETLKTSPDFLVWMHSHNETGVIFPLKEYLDLCKSMNPKVRLVCDLVQSVGKLRDIDTSFMDAFFISGHKIGALPGVGVLVVKNDFPIIPFIVGGSQERYMRGGTENYHAIISLTAALRYWKQKIDLENVYREKKELLKRELTNRCGSKIEFLFEKFPTIPNTLHLAYQGKPSSQVLVALDLRGVCCSAGSSCFSGKPKPPSLDGFLVPDDISTSVLRLSFRHDISDGDLIHAAEIIAQVISAHQSS